MNRLVAEGITTLREGGILPFSYRTLRYLDIWDPAWNTVTSRRPIGENVYNRDWDVLVILDACRVDALSAVGDSLSWIDAVASMRSVGSTSPEWVLNTFIEDHLPDIERTALVSRNIWSQRILDDRLHEHQNHSHEYLKRGNSGWDPVSAGAFAHHERVQPIDDKDDRIHPESTAIPHVVTDRAISVGREMDVDRLIVWYSMPHQRLIADALDWIPGECSLGTLMSGPEPVRDLRPEEKSYGPARRGDVSRRRVRELYSQNLRFVLEYVDIFLENIGAQDVVISADHGEGLGEGIWGHPHGYPWSPVKTVPWAATTGTDERTYEPKYEPPSRKPVEREQKEILEDMGYL